MLKIANAITLIFVLHGFCQAAALEVRIKDQKGSPVPDAVIEVVSSKGPGHSDASLTLIDQINKEFVPYLTTIAVGSAVNFPNKDDIRHHVYSFSRAKPFEIPLYKGIPAKPVVFDKPGVVVLGCNIHDWMRAYIYVAESEVYIRTNDDGQGKIENLATGEYRVRIWHAQMRKAKQPNERLLTLKEDQNYSLDTTVKLRSRLRIRRAPTPRRDRDY